VADASVDIAITAKDLTSEAFGKVTEALKALGPAGEAAAGVLGGIATAEGVVVGVTAALVTHALHLGDQLYEMSLKTGASVENLSALRFVASQTGIDFESFGNILFKMQQALGASGTKADEMQKHLDLLHLNLQTLKNEKPDQAFIDIMSALEQIPNRADQAAIGMAVFGKGFKDMAALTQENIKDLIQQANDLGLVMSTSDAAAAHAAEIGLKSFHMQLDAIEVKIGAAFLPAMIGLEQNIGTVLKGSVDSANTSLDKMGGGSGFIATVARAMGTGNGAIAAQVTLYEMLRDTLINVARYGIEPAITAFGFVGQEVNAAKVVFGDLAQILGGDIVAFDYLRLGLLKLSSITPTGMVFSAEVKKEIDEVNSDLTRQMTLMVARVASLQTDKQNEKWWADFAVEANTRVEAALNQLGSTHTDVAAVIAKFAKISHDAYGGMSDAAVEAAKPLADLNKKVEADYTAMTHLIEQGATHDEILKALGPDVDKYAEEFAKLGLNVLNVDNRAGLMIATFQNWRVDDLEQKVVDVNKFMASILDGKDHAEEDFQKTYMRNLGLQEAAQKETYDHLKAMGVDSLQARLDESNREFQIKYTAAKADQTTTQETLDAMVRAHQAATAQVEYDWKTAHDTIRTGLVNVLESLPQTFEQAFMGGGGFMGALKALASQIVGVFTQSISDAIKQALTQSFTKQAIGSLTGGGGGSNLLGSASSLAGLFGGGGASTGGVAAWTEMSTAGAGAAAGAGGAGGIGSAIGAFALAGGAATMGVGALMAYLITSTKTTYQMITEQMDHFAALEKQQLDLQGKIKQDNADLDALRKSQVPDWQEMTTLAEKYGGTLTDLGPVAEQLKITGEATDVINDYERMIAGSHDVGAVATLMAGSISGLVQEAKAYGDAIPENLRPAIELLVSQGKLVDATGAKLTDLSGIAFGDPVKTQADIISDAIQTLVDKVSALIDQLAGLGPAIGSAAAAGSASTSWVNHEPGGVTGGDVSGGGYVDASGTYVPGFAGGTDGEYIDFGRGTLVTLHNRERVMTEAEGRRGGGPSSAPMVVQVVMPNGRVLAESVFDEMPDVWRARGAR
jgi:hypothetical protein